MQTLPIDALKQQTLEAIQHGPVVISAPTGSGKSTQVPRWLQTLGRVLVIEPRRVAARALASRVSDLEQTKLGSTVGYAVRDERCANEHTAILFVTPGVALRMVRSNDIDRFTTVVVDEFHERSLDMDLLLALLQRRRTPTPVVMSATVEGDRIAAHLQGRHLIGEGRLHPVTCHHIADGSEGPDIRGLETRLQRALAAAANDPGDILVFLPGKAEITAAQSAIQGPFEVLVLHGGLTLRQQTRIFEPSQRRRVILSTNVAETSLTVPGIGVVIDAGLVRRTQYHHGRGYLTLMPIAQDSAEQRAGRAGRLGPGVCYRLWSARSALSAHTPPEIHRESLTPLVLGAMACNTRPDALPFVDPPRAFALEDAHQQLQELGAIDPDERLTTAGEQLFGLPLDAHLGRLLIEANHHNTLNMVIPLVASLSTPRRLFAPHTPSDSDDFRSGNCDAIARIRALWHGHPKQHSLDPVALREARNIQKRLWALWPNATQHHHIDRTALAKTLIQAWPRCAHVARRRRRNTAWSNGGTELTLGKHSHVDEDRAEALLVLESRAMGLGQRRRSLIITAGMPVSLSSLAVLGLGRKRMGVAHIQQGRISIRAEQIYAGAVISTIEETPQGELARQAVRDLLLNGALRPALKTTLQQRHALASLAAQLNEATALLPLSEWLLERLTTLGLESTDELALIDDDDLLPEMPPPSTLTQIERNYPLNLSIGDATYSIVYDVHRRVATLHQTGGNRKTPPPERYLPRLSGWTVCWAYKNRVRTIRSR